MSAPTYLHASCTPGPNRKAKDGDSCAEPQQPFRFMDLPPELRDIIYTFTLCKETRKLYFRNNLNELNLLAGLSKSLTARALNQVCRTVRQESIKVFYFNVLQAYFKFPELTSKAGSKVWVILVFIYYSIAVS